MIPKEITPVPSFNIPTASISTTDKSRPSSGKSTPGSNRKKRKSIIPKLAPEEDFTVPDIPVETAVELDLELPDVEPEIATPIVESAPIEAAAPVNLSPHEKRKRRDKAREALTRKDANPSAVTGTNDEAEIEKWTEVLANQVAGSVRPETPEDAPSQAGPQVAVSALLGNNANKPKKAVLRDYKKKTGEKSKDEEAGVR